MDTSFAYDAPPATPKRVFKVDPEHELRVETDAPVDVTLLAGTAEIFGCELASNHVYKFAAGTKTAIFTWYGCEIEILGQTAVAYVANETPMPTYLNTHAALEARRELAAQDPTGKTRGPRVMIVGPMDSGKSSLARILLSYAVRRGRKPTFVDLDIGQGAISIPGCIAATPVERPVDPMDVFAHAVPLAYFFGGVSLSDNARLYEHLVQRLADQLDARLEKDPVFNASGLIINTCGWVDGLGYQLLLFCANALAVDVLLVLGQERLYVELCGERDLARRQAHVVKLAKSGGVVTRDQGYRRKTRMDRIREYFYGPADDLCPAALILNFRDVSIFRIGGQPAAPTSALPIGAESTNDPLRLTEVLPTPDLQHTILGVSHAPSADFLLSANLAGFVYVQHVDMERQKITLLAPTPGPTPSRFFLAGTLKWLDVK
eukprot:tig00020537_g10298.t1